MVKCITMIHGKDIPMTTKENTILTIVAIVMFVLFIVAIILRITDYCKFTKAINLLIANGYTVNHVKSGNWIEISDYIKADMENGFEINLRYVRNIYTVNDSNKTINIYYR